MLANNWKQNLHLEPEKGWLNDPNGLAYFKGKYHIFHQYSYEVNGGLKLWYYYTSKDLIKYEDRGVFLTPTIEEEKSGVYSGSANVEGDKLVFYYTGNVKYKGDYDYVHAGRGHNTISFSTEDGVNFTEKKCLLTTDDYPNMSNHVRDPKVFEKNGKNYLVLGARDSNDYGCLLVYDKDTLEPYKTIYSEKNLGFMWECPDYFEVDGKEIFMFSPQGISRMYPNFENMYQIGYSIVEEGIENVDKVVNVDQSPIGRTPRSNPATYTGVFSDIRNLFVNLPEAKIRGYKPGRFSFNVKGGRCENCGGNGYRTIEMNFLPDVFVPCEVCHGKRYNRETLEVRFKGKSIADVLDMTVNTAVEFFENVPLILPKIKALQDVGLGYIKLGQSSTTLSGGESQRVKLATELSKRDTGKTLYILDEPTTGLHFEDIRVLMGVLQKLVDRGNTVIIIEHNLDVIKQADYIIDMGPDGGRGGGQIIATGTPAEIEKVSQSYTAPFIKKFLNVK